MSNKKRVFISVIAFIAAVSCFTSCGNKTEISNEQSSELSSESSIEVTDESINNNDNNNAIPDEDESGNKITAITVTEANGIVVTDSNNKPVTQLVVVDNSNNIITEANGEPAKPVTKQTTSTTQATTTNAAITEQVVSSSSDNTTTVKDAYKGCLWLCSAKKVNGEAVYDSLKSDGEIIKITVKVKDNTPDGDYSIDPVFSTSSGTSGCIVDVKSKSVNVNIVPGIITVGGSKKESTSSSTDPELGITNTAAQPGETVTMYAYLSNVANKEVTAFNFFFNYSSEFIEIETISAYGELVGYGDFAS